MGSEAVRKSGRVVKGEMEICRYFRKLSPEDRARALEVVRVIYLAGKVKAAGMGLVFVFGGGIV